jgi:tetratricopeptide (TPR) repeat protein
MPQSLTMLLLKVACLCIVLPGVCNAQNSFDKKRGGPQMPTAQEIRFLPPYCVTKWKIDTGSPELNAEDVKKWQDIFGDAFISMHHYCFGLNFLNRLDRGLVEKDVLLGLALGDFQYMETHTPDWNNNVLRPDVEYNVGLVLYKMDNIPQAIEQLIIVVKIKPDFERAYLLLSFCYRRLGDLANAANTLRVGLTRVPHSRALRDALDEMNSKKNDPDSGENG